MKKKADKKKEVTPAPLCIAGCGHAATRSQKADGGWTYLHWFYYPSCWLKLSPEERGVLNGKTPEKLIEIEIRERVIPASPLWVWGLGIIWRVLVSSVLAYLFFKK